MPQIICTRCGGQLGDSDSQVTLCEPCLLHVVMNSQDSYSATDGLAHDTGPRIAPQTLHTYTKCTYQHPRPQPQQHTRQHWWFMGIQSRMRIWHWHTGQHCQMPLVSFTSTQKVCWRWCICVWYKQSSPLRYINHVQNPPTTNRRGAYIGGEQRCIS